MSNPDHRGKEERRTFGIGPSKSVITDDDLDAEIRYRAQIENFLERLPNIYALLDQAEAAEKQAWADFRFRLAHTQSPMLSAYRGQREALRSFMAKHHLEGRAQQPIYPLRHYGLVAFLILIETILNGTMLARGMETGFVGGWGVAGAVSFFNVVMLGFTFGGFALRQANHIEVWRKVFGVVVLAGILALIYSSNLLVAHYRDALGGSDPDNAETTALATWLAAPFDPLKVRDAQSLWLFGLGLAFSLLGMAEGYRADDPYPGYGRLWRHYETLLNEYRPQLERNLNELRATEEQLLGGLKNLTDEIEDRYHDFLEIKGRSDMLHNHTPLFEMAKAGLDRFPERRVQEVLSSLAETRRKIIEEFTRAIDSLEPLD